MVKNTTSTLGLYIHIPWCPTRCIYCDFNTYVDGRETLKLRYHAALLREIREAGAVLGRPALDTIFFGGGTPTTLAPEQLIELVDTVRESFLLRPDAEITTEANPGTLSTEYLRDLRQGGINRLSMGVQSFDDDELRFLSRLHDADTARRAVEMARTAGFDNISLDLIFNLPYQTLEQWQYNVRQALNLAPDHFSFYSLILEPGTPLHKLVTRGEVPEPDDDIAADMYEWTMDALQDAGYAQYEISNWARVENFGFRISGGSEASDFGIRKSCNGYPLGESAIGNPQSAIGNPQSAIGNWQSAIGNPQSAIGNPESAIYSLSRRNPQFLSGALTSWETPSLASTHNLIYWRNQPYLGLGAGAYGTIDGQRWANVKRPQRYINMVQQGAGLGMARNEKSVELIDRKTEMLEQIMLGLRLVREGVGAQDFQSRFRVPLDDIYAQPIAVGIQRGLLEWIQTPTQPRLRLTKAGRLLANQAIVEFFL